MKVLIINNLASGYGEGSIYDYLRSLMQDGDEVVIRSSNGQTAISSLLHDAKDFDVVVASGGDGTVSTVAYALRNTGIPVLPFPAGTANLLTLNLLSPTEPHALAKLTREGAQLDFDMGEFEIDGETKGFMMMAGAGYDATIMEGAAQTKKLLGPASYLLAASTNIMPQVSDITLTIDDETIHTKGLGVIVINFSKIQFDISFTHCNQPRDGHLDVVVLKAKNAIELLPSMLAALLDRDGEFPARGDGMEIFSGKEIRVEADPPFDAQYDGEAGGMKTPFTARVLPHAIKLIVSDEAAHLFD